MPRCRGCNAEIVFLETPKGKWIPCDTDPVSSDDLDHDDLIVAETGEVFSCKVLEAPIVGRVPHWASCPKAAQFRGGA